MESTERTEQVIIPDSLIESYRDSSIDYGWWHCIYDDFIVSAEECGFNVEAKDIYFSGFCSQGDGACFYGSYDNSKALDELIEALSLHDTFISELYRCQGIHPMAEELLDEPTDEELAVWKAMVHLDEGGLNDSISKFVWDFTVKIKQISSRYCHENTMECEYSCDHDWEYATERMINAIEDCASEITERIEEEAKDMARKLYCDLNEEYDYITSDEAIKESIIANEYKQDEWITQSIEDRESKCLAA